MQHIKAVAESKKIWHKVSKLRAKENIKKSKVQGQVQRQNHLAKAKAKSPKVIL